MCSDLVTGARYSVLGPRYTVPAAAVARTAYPYHLVYAIYWAQGCQYAPATATHAKFGCFPTHVQSLITTTPRPTVNMGVVVVAPLLDTTHSNRLLEEIAPTSARLVGLAVDIWGSLKERLPDACTASVGRQ